MLYDRCYLTKRNNEWIGLVELRQRIGERWRFAAWLAFIIAGVEAFRLALAGFWYFNKIEFVILILSTVFAIAFFRRSSKTYKYRETVIKIPQPEPVYDEVGQILGYRQIVYLPEDNTFKPYDVSRFTHVVYGLIDYPWPGRKNVNIEAFALYLAEKDGTPHALVEGCFDKYTCYTLGRRISALTKLPIIELGKGQPFIKEKKENALPQNA
jgi:hypothetical protein